MTKTVTMNRRAVFTGAATLAIPALPANALPSESQAAKLGLELRQSIISEKQAWAAATHAEEAREAFVDSIRPACLFARDEDVAWGIPGAAQLIKFREHGYQTHYSEKNVEVMRRGRLTAFDRVRASLFNPDLADDVYSIKPRDVTAPEAKARAAEIVAGFDAFNAEMLRSGLIDAVKQAETAARNAEVAVNAAILALSIAPAASVNDLIPKMEALAYLRCVTLDEFMSASPEADLTSGGEAEFLLLASIARDVQALARAS